MIVSHIAMNSWEIVIGGCDIHREREKGLEVVGAVAENPKLYTNLSGKENLMKIAEIQNIYKKVIEDIIELVGLKYRIHDKVRNNSLEMKQRLRLVAVLMFNHKLSILVEHTN